MRKSLVDQSSCIAPGYAYAFSGSAEQFTGWTGTTTQDGWTNVDNNGTGQIWQFDNPATGRFRRAATPTSPSSTPTTTASATPRTATLVSPVSDLTSQTTPEIGFDTFYRELLELDRRRRPQHRRRPDVGERLAPDDDGASGPRRHPDPAGSRPGGRAGTVPLHGQLRLVVGDRQRVPRHAYLRAAARWPGRRCRHRRQHRRQDQRREGVQTTPTPTEFGVSAATPDDANLSDGFYWLFSSLTGNQQFTASDGKYVPAKATVNVGHELRHPPGLGAQGRPPAVTPGSVSVTETLGAAKSKKVTLDQ